ncbi:site-specific integrase [Peribacillus glennii]|uniref:Site-specific integrase n=1 Tax=Peribacillus glennii TaxID=2303991 RepID=A0A372L6A3_9BACI|nr:site-specific integrase [Peribacillus glennii]
MRKHYLFLSYEGQSISQATVRDNLAVCGKVARIKGKRVSPHTFQHTAALFYILNGGDPFSLQKTFKRSSIGLAS